MDEQITENEVLALLGRHQITVFEQDKTIRSLRTRIAELEAEISGLRAPLDVVADNDLAAVDGHK